jgi:predicted alpha-1,2-mannosidase
MQLIQKSSFFVVFNLLLIGCISAQQNLAKLVNPFVRTGGHVHTFPGAVVPFGMVQLGPDTRVDGSWDGCSGYHYSDSVIYGFSHTHLSGTGISDWGDMMLMPVMGSQIQFSPKEYSSKFSHQKENASAGYYRVHLDDENIDVELTTTTRVGFHRYTFHQKGEAQVILDLLHRDKLLDGSIHIVNQSGNRVIEGYRRSKAWVPNQQVYFRMEFSKPFKQHAIVSNDSMQTQGGFVFDVNKEEQLLVKVSISSVDVDGARKNMEAELQHWNFDKVNADAEALWNKELNTIQVKGGTPKQQTIFYTALYHCFIHPSIASDVDGRYLGRDFMIHQADGFNYYTVFSLWDTFRALHPLFNLLQRERNLDFIKTFLAQYQHSGRLPMWELSSNETNCMIGYHSVSVIADAYAKGIREFDVDLAIKACLDATKYNNWAIPIFHQKGFLEAEDEHESVSKTLEYAYNDWCLTQFIRDSKRSVPEYASLLQSSSKTFKDSLQLTVINLTPKHPMVLKKYDIQSGKEDSSVTKRNSVSIVISKSTNLTVSLFQKPYTTVSSSFYKKPNVWSATVKHQPNKQYAAGGSEALIDGIYGYQNWRKGNWQGYQSVDVEVIIDLKESKNIKLLKSSYLQDSRSWILFPKEVAFYVSSDGVQYTLVGKQYHSISPLLDSVMVQKFGIQPNDSVNAQYVKVVATNFGQLPVGHQGFGGDAFIFVDEVEIE